MADVVSLGQAKEKLDELLELAKKRTISPDSFPNQLEDVMTLLQKAETELSAINGVKLEEVVSLGATKEKLNELLGNAQKGMIIPIRLPSQIEEIVTLAKKASEEAITVVKTAKAASVMPTDMESFMKDEAYFLGHAIHELRTPMTSIRGYTDMLRSMGELNPMQQQFMGVIQNNIKRMESLLTDMSYYNKLRHKTLKMSPKMDMFKNIAIGLEKDMGVLAQELGRQLVVEVPQGLPILNTDTDLLTVAFKKLIENGLRYSPNEGKVTVTGSADGKNLVVKIADNGIGMTPEELAKLGQLYFRGENDTVTQFKGSGLGIPIAYGIVELLGGSISVESEPKVGTTFTITLAGMS